MAKKKTVSNPGSPTKPVSAFDETLFAEIEDHSKQMVSDDGLRNTMFEDIDRAYLMTWTGKAGKQWNKAEIKQSPDARNAALGAVRLLVATDPIFNIVNSKEKQSTVEKLETAAAKIFDAAGRAGGNPIHYDALLSAILYSEMHIAITTTASLVEAAKQNGRGVQRAERMAMITPLIIDVWNPKEGHAEFDYLGMTSYYRETDTSYGKLRADFGSLLPDAAIGKKSTDTTKLKTYYDIENTVQWIDDGVIIFEAHKLPFIPVMVQYTEGSSLWKKPEESRQPLLYTLLKSGMWEMQNLIYTVMYTLIKDMGVTPLYAHTTPPGGEGKQLDIDYDNHPGVVHLAQGETFTPLMNKGLIDPAVQQGLSLATTKVQESTLYPQALGAPVQGDSTFSELALLSQSGRLPLVGTQKRGGWGLGSLMEMCFAMLKSDGEKIKSPNIDLKISDIPDYVQFDVKLDVKLPQDKLQQANIAQMISTGDDPITSKRWARENVLNIGKSGEMDREIWTEKATQIMFQDFMQQQMKQSRMAAQQAMAAGQPGSMPPGQPGQMSAGPMMPEGQGQMVQGGLPPQMAGMMPGAGQGSIPQEGMM